MVASLTYIDDNGKRRQRIVASGKRRADVATKLDEARRRLAADKPVKDARVTVAMFVEDWIRKALPTSGRQAQWQTTQSLPGPTSLPHRSAR